MQGAFHTAVFHVAIGQLGGTVGAQVVQGVQALSFAEHRHGQSAHHHGPDGAVREVIGFAHVVPGGAGVPGGFNVCGCLHGGSQMGVANKVGTRKVSYTTRLLR
ncbi:hypothetical protein D3C72_2230920 [compost metagenome]